MHSINCPCGNNKPYIKCCGPYHDGSALPETAEALMRSRYTAYVTQNKDYLLATWHSNTRPAQLNLDAQPRKWLGLKIINIEAGGSGDVEGKVEFVAKYTVGGRAVKLAEKSRFCRVDGKWIYVDGEI